MPYPKKIFMSIPEAGMHGNTLELNITEALTLWCRANDLNDKNAQEKIKTTKKCIRKSMEFLHREMQCEKEGGIVGKAFGYEALVTKDHKNFLNKKFIAENLHPEILSKIKSLPKFFDTFVL
jgi:hypothetical protein